LILETQDVALQKQKLCFARALVHNPDVLLTDEPTSSLDAESKVIVEDLVAQLGLNNTIVFVSHDLAKIDSVADHVISVKIALLLRALSEHLLLLF